MSNRYEEREPPLVKGGQGRSAESVACSAGVVCGVLACAVLWLTILMIWDRCAA